MPFLDFSNHSVSDFCEEINFNFKKLVKEGSLPVDQSSLKASWPEVLGGHVFFYEMYKNIQINKE